MMRYILAIFSILFSSTVLSLSLDQQRVIYTEASQLQEKKRWDEADEKLSSIPIYPLSYLLEYQQLKSDFSPENRIKISAFIDRNKHYKISVT